MPSFNLPQEGHTAHATPEEAEEETIRMLRVRVLGRVLGDEAQWHGSSGDGRVQLIPREPLPSTLLHSTLVHSTRCTRTLPAMSQPCL